MASRPNPSRKTKSKKSRWAWLRWLLSFGWLRSGAKASLPATTSASGKAQPSTRATIPSKPAEIVMPPKTVGSMVYFSPGDDCLHAIVNQLSSARKTLDICVFTISDDRISDAIVACHRNKVQVRIITDNEKLHDLGADIERFATAGIAVRIDRTEAHMHHKFALMDGKSLLTGSYNWTRSAAIYNHENVLVTSEAQVIAAYAREFHKLWDTLDDY
jgi:mitochondrial cardiolipin hydrolase